VPVPAVDSDLLAALAERALTLVRDETAIGLGAGRAARAFVRALGRRVGEGLRVRGVPASEETAALARELGIPLTTLEEPLDLTVDGADEVDPRLDLIKGYGGALTRERIVAAASRRQVILVTEDKLVPMLGSRGRLPVEVIPFALPLVRRRLGALGYTGQVRALGERPSVTDNSNVVVDVEIHPLPEPGRVDQAIRDIPGVVDTGLFLGTASLVFVGGPTGVRELQR
jgi:ribose 5-phosphate isomerase A